MGAFVAVDNWYLYSPWRRLSRVLNIYRNIRRSLRIDELVVFEDLQLKRHRSGSRLLKKAETLADKVSSSSSLQNILAAASRSRSLNLGNIRPQVLEDELIPYLEYVLLADRKGNVENPPSGGRIRVDNRVRSRIKALLKGATLIDMTAVNPSGYAHYLVERVRKILRIPRLVRRTSKGANLNALIREVKSTYCDRYGSSCPVIERGQSLELQHRDDVMLAAEILGYHEDSGKPGLVFVIPHEFECFSHAISVIEAKTNRKIKKIPHG